MLYTSYVPYPNQTAWRGGIGKPLHFVHNSRTIELPSFEPCTTKKCHRNTHNDFRTPHSINRITPHNNSDDSNHSLHGTTQTRKRDSGFQNTANQRIQQTVPRTKSMGMVTFRTLGATSLAMWRGQSRTSAGCETTNHSHQFHRTHVNYIRTFVT